MPGGEPSTISLGDFVRTLITRPLRWILPTLLLGGAAYYFSLSMEPSWQASQAMIVRDEASGSVERPGKFRHLDEMKTLQETLLELVKGSDVLSAALIEAGEVEPEKTEPEETEQSPATEPTTAAPTGEITGALASQPLELQPIDSASFVSASMASPEKIAENAESVESSGSTGNSQNSDSAFEYAVANGAAFTATTFRPVSTERKTEDVIEGELKVVDETELIAETLESSETATESPATGPSATVSSTEVSEQTEQVTSEPSSTEPSPEAIDKLRKSIKLSPPKGAEFGTTEIFYLDVKATSPERAVKLATSISNQLRIQSQKLRNDRAQSIIEELTRAVDLAKHDLDQATQSLSAIEGAVGADLAELRLLNDFPSGDSHLRRVITEVQNEIRQVRATQANSTQLLELLKKAQVEPTRLLAAPNSLLESQPSLRVIKEGVISTQLETAKLMGMMSEDHPLVSAAVDAEAKAKQNLHLELSAAIEGLELELRVSELRINDLQQQLTASLTRMQELAAMRAEYANVADEVKHYAEIYRRAKQELLEAKASEAGAQNTSLISNIGSPAPGLKPVGPTPKLVTAAGIVAGLLLGLSLVFLTATPRQPRPQPSTDLPGVSPVAATVTPAVHSPVVVSTHLAAPNEAGRTSTVKDSTANESVAVVVPASASANSAAQDSVTVVSPANVSPADVSSASASHISSNLSSARSSTSIHGTQAQAETTHERVLPQQPKTDEKHA